MAALAALAQTVSLLPRSTRARSLLYVFVLCSFFPLLKTDAASRSRHILVEKLSVAKQTRHPIDILIDNSSEELSTILKRQSLTLEAAVVEYRKRYCRNPPPGFDRWFQYAKEHQSVLIDDFDSITESLKPFWTVTPAQLRKNIEDALSAQDSQLWTFRI